MTLGELIEELKKEPRDKVLPLGFHKPHSYRGYYDELAFELCENVAVGEVLDTAQGAVASTYSGWKGGEYEMHESTDCWLAKEGRLGETLGPILLSFLLGRTPKVEP